MALYTGTDSLFLGAKCLTARPRFSVFFLLRRLDGKAGKLDRARYSLGLSLRFFLGLTGCGKNKKSEDENETESVGEKHRKSPFQPRTGPVSNRDKGASTIIQGRFAAI